jgi:hypothetical protein
MLKTTALPQVTAGQPGLTTHEATVRHTRAQRGE